MRRPVSARAVVGASLAAVLAAMAMPATTRAAPATGTRITVRACPYAGVTTPCLMINGADGTVYNITAANPKPPPGGMIRLRATVTDKLSACTQGTVLDAIRWRAVQGNCPN